MSIINFKTTSSLASFLLFVNILSCNMVSENHVAEFVTPAQTFAPTPTPADNFDCSDGWKITGYFTPIEAEYNSSRSTEKIVITKEFSSTTKSYNLLKDKSEKFSKEFLKNIYDKESCDKFLSGKEEFDCGEGFGKTRFGWYLGGYVNEADRQWIWIKSDVPLGDSDNPLDLNTVAIEIDSNNQIPRASLVKIPDLPAPYNTKTFSVKDVGLSVGSKQIDVYCGEGKSAEEETFRITRQNSNELVKVCYKKPV